MVSSSKYMKALKFISTSNLRLGGYPHPTSIVMTVTSTENALNTDKATVYEKIRLIYCRDNEKIINQRGFNFSGIDNFSKLVTSPVVGGDIVIRRQIGSSLTSFETQRKDGTFAGVIAENHDFSLEFEKWFIELVVKTNYVDYPPISQDDFTTYSDLIADKFVKELKNTTESDKWHLGGETYFKEVVSFFTSRWIPIEAVLPAFPCKSSNLSKVASALPDMGEILALKRLISFANSIKQVYPPGLKIWIVSDGHVFSDCIDDETVNQYSDALKGLYATLKAEYTDEDPIQFNSLVDIFSLKLAAFDRSLINNVELEHYLDTKVDGEAEDCRKILVTSCDTDCGKLEKDINTPHHPRLHLFRGFSRFMTEDLQGHPIVQEVSRKKFKKIIGKVAFEMIKRNDAYSNLVELMFPFHLRLSIHAHKNDGPKFGIQLLASEDCFVINSIEDHKCPLLSDLLHIPTPWHNSIAEFNNQKPVFVIKSGHILKGYKEGKGEGSWNCERLCYEYRTKL